MLTFNLLDKTSPEYRKARKDGLARRRSKEWRVANPERVKELNARHYNPYRARRHGLMRNYGITDIQVDQMWLDQKGLCGGCATWFPPDTMHVDHCHKTLKVRGLLCQECNLSLGLARDNPETLRRLADYLEKK